MPLYFLHAPVNYVVTSAQTEAGKMGQHVVLTASIRQSPRHWRVSVFHHSENRYTRVFPPSDLSLTSVCWPRCCWKFAYCTQRSCLRLLSPTHSATKAREREVKVTAMRSCDQTNAHVQLGSPRISSNPGASHVHTAESEQTLCEKRLVA